MAGYWGTPVYMFKLMAVNIFLLFHFIYFLGDCHAGVLNAYCIVETNTKFYILHPFIENTVHSCITFSPSVLESSPLKTLFIIYQLLNVIRDIHNKGLNVGNISLDNLLIDDSLWLQVSPQSWLAYDDDVTGKTLTPEISPQLAEELASNPETICPSSESLEVQVKKWIHGAISNFEYLLILNKLAGRTNANPNYYPVLPWIMDFTVPKGGWRDLSKSKYRLNKGDQQLDLTYDSAALYPNSASEAEGNTYHPIIPQTQVQ